MEAGNASIALSHKVSPVFGTNPTGKGTTGFFMGNCLRYFFILVTIISCLQGCAAFEKPYTPDFTFRHSKAKSCDAFWLTFERLVKNEGTRCSELISIDHFPYLRGTEGVIQTGLSLNDKKAWARWLELMRTVDMQARYKELDTLSDDSWGLLCSAAGIVNCEGGRLRAYTARCSALLLGDERLNPEFRTTFRQAAENALKRERSQGRRCFQDELSLDGLIPDNLLKALTESHTSYRGGATLQQRVDRVKKATAASPGTSRIKFNFNTREAH
jgi:hypothetical protein